MGRGFRNANQPTIIRQVDQSEAELLGLKWDPSTITRALRLNRISSRRTCWIVRWTGKPSVIPTSPIDGVRKLHRIAFGENDLLCQVSGLG